MNIAYQATITIEPGKRSGKPGIRGLRITVYDVLSWLAQGMPHEKFSKKFTTPDDSLHSKKLPGQHNNG